MSDCMCSLEYGPCEEHGEVLVIREGASVRTADELALCLVDDLVELGAELSPYGVEVVDEARAALDACEGPCRWLDDADLSSELASVADQLDCSSDFIVVQDDGYVIWRVGEDFWSIVEGSAIDR